MTSSDRGPTLRAISWGLVVLSLLFLLWALWATPSAYQGVLDSRRLSRGSNEAQGIVVALLPKHGRVKRCTSQAIVEYRVDTATYQTEAIGCGAADGGSLKVGDRARVIYAIEAPEIANASAKGASTQRPGWSVIFALWITTLVTSFGAWFSFHIASRWSPDAA